jgi:hypothetical protein
MPGGTSTNLLFFAGQENLRGAFWQAESSGRGDVGRLSQVSCHPLAKE